MMSSLEWKNMLAFHQPGLIGLVFACFHALHELLDLIESSLKTCM
jgi:hypothetical protein